MALTKKPVTGMKDILPAEMQIRDYVTSLVKETYTSFGFRSIETPCVEHLNNLCSKQGGENEKLIFKIMKRGEKLDLEKDSAVSFDNVLAVGGDSLAVGDDVKNATVSGKVLDQVKGKKVVVYHYKRKTGYHKKNGHRQAYTKVQIDKINEKLKF